MDKWTVWVGGVEITDQHVEKEKAEQLAAEYVTNGYDDVQIEEVTL